MKLEKFVDVLPIPPILRALRRSESSVYYEVTMRQTYVKFHRDLPKTKVWGYEGMVPGPTIDVKSGETAYVKWSNDLPSKHFLPVDKTLSHGHLDPEVRTVVHLHGGVTPEESDGYPEAWFTKKFQHVGPYFKNFIYKYPNQQPSATLWYHDHAMTLTRLNVYAGLAGFYFIRDNKEKKFRLPAGKYEIPLLIQDKTFLEDGSLFYPSQPNNPTPNTPNPSIVPFFCGDNIIVNGKVWPYLEVEPRKYRFRILNGSNTRTYELSLSSNQSFIQIGTDSGFLQRPKGIKKIILAPAERVDVIIDFKKLKGKSVILQNGNGCGGPVNPEDDANVMKFSVTKNLDGIDRSCIPCYMRKKDDSLRRCVKRIRKLKVTASRDMYNRPMLLLDDKMWHDPVSEIMRAGDVEIWEFLNVTGGVHPIHLHLVYFYILDRQPFDVKFYNETGEIRFTGSPIMPDQSERGPKDVVRAFPGYITRIIARFGPYKGRYVWHCHLLEHEDHDMMRPFQIIK
ncbi:multicopper oxidase family protein [Bacillus gaemokensis]|uniref:Copper oxidase n=1 Tax=Bacillus gaemokensis TaxID=574375 RepID=A0A073KGF2_9BACI|nr:multicopper oxidase domain-containing protein [Bacillus gaemokensis]KEK25586.1 copper oxidase [Bacillus gaemokensis]KYG36972.1 copper oxidase [Bacillus gaemokensis]